MGLADYIAAPAGGSLQGYRNITTNSSGFVNGETEGAFIAAYTFFILAVFFIFISPGLVSKPKKSEKDAEIQASSSSDMQQVSSSTIHEQIERPCSFEIQRNPSQIQKEEEQQVHAYSFKENFLVLGWAFKDAFLMILATNLITLSGFGMTAGPLVLIWIVFAFLILW